MIDEVEIVFIDKTDPLDPTRREEVEIVFIDKTDPSDPTRREEVEIVSIDKTDPSDPTRREEFWRTKLKTLAPYGLNVEEWLLLSTL